MIIKVDQEGFDAIKKLSDNALRTMGLQALNLVEGVHNNIELEDQDNGKEKKIDTENVQEKKLSEAGG